MVTGYVGKASPPQGDFRRRGPRSTRQCHKQNKRRPWAFSQGLSGPCLGPGGVSSPRTQNTLSTRPPQRSFHHSPRRCCPRPVLSPLILGPAHERPESAAAQSHQRPAAGTHKAQAGFLTLGPTRGLEEPLFLLPPRFREKGAAPRCAQALGGNPSLSTWY